MRPKMCQLWVQIPVLLGLMSDGFDFQPNQPKQFLLPAPHTVLWGNPG